MHSLSIKDLIAAAALDHGALDFDDRGTGLAPRRLPDWTRAQLPQPMDVVVRMPSGVRLRFATDSTTVGVSFLATNMAMPGRERRGVVFNLETGGTLLRAESTSGNAIVVKPEAPGGFDLVRGEADTLVFDGMASGDKTCELWLPHNAFIELRALEVEDGATISAAPADTRRRWVHYGSSISHCVEASEPAGTWPAVAARLAGVSLRNLGFGGQCHLDQFVARTIRDLPDVDIVSIKTGINIVNMDSMRERVFTPALHGFLDTIREAKPDVPIVVISPIYCPSAETRPGPTIPDGQGKFVRWTASNSSETAACPWCASARSSPMWWRSAVRQATRHCTTSTGLPCSVPTTPTTCPTTCTPIPQATGVWANASHPGLPSSLPR